MGIASLSMLLVGMNAILHMLVRAWERADLSAKAYLGAALVYLPILFLLIKQLGIFGAALSLFLYSATELFLLLLFTKSLTSDTYFGLADPHPKPTFTHSGSSGAGNDFAATATCLAAPMEAIDIRRGLSAFQLGVCVVHRLFPGRAAVYSENAP
jgi:hypothetical protein